MRLTVSGQSYHPEYMHHNRVDGDNRYGAAWFSYLPRRAMVGGCIAGNKSGETPYQGSRAIEANLGTAYSDYADSNR